MGILISNSREMIRRSLSAAAAQYYFVAARDVYCESSLAIVM